MALVLADRVRDTTTTTGTGTITLSGTAPTGYQNFSVVGNGNTTYYTINADSQWEVGIGTYSSTGPTLSRNTVLASSNGGALVDFAVGTKDVFITYPAEKAVTDAYGTALAATTATNIAGGAAGSIPYQTAANTTSLLAAGTGVLVGGSTPSYTMSPSLTQVTVATDPSTALQVATKQYVDTIAASGVTYHTPVKYETPTALTATYNNGSSGVGATLTNAGTLAAFAPDGPTASVGDRILVYNQANPVQNGVYTVTTVGSGSVAWVLTRATDADTYALKSPNGLGEGDAFFVTSGDTGAGETYICNTSGTITFGTTAITFVQVSSAQVYSAGTGLTLTGTVFSLTSPVATTLGGTGLTSFTSGGAVYATSSSALTTGTLPATAGGTGQSSYTTGDLIYATSGTALGALADVATGNALLSGGVGAAPAWGKVGLTTHVTGTLPVANGGTGATSLTGYLVGNGTSAFTTTATIPTSDLSGTISLTTQISGTLGAGNGGTGISSYTVGDILYASATTTLSTLADVATGNALISGGVSNPPSWGKIGLTTHVSGTLPVSNGGSGATTLTGYLKGNGTSAFTASATIPAGDITGAALTKADDTNVTLTLGGSPSTALLAATSITAGWTGQLAVSRGGTGATSLSSGYVLKGNGTSAVSASVIYDNGTNVGVGTATPSQKFTTQGASLILPAAGWSTGQTAYSYLGDTNNGVSSTFGGPTNVFGFNGVIFSAQGSQLGSFDTSGNGFATTSFRAPIFYDSDNTAYYLDAAGNSVFSAFNIGGGEVYFYGSATNAVSIRTGGGGAYKYFTFDASGNFYALNGSVYGGRFYDQDNTAYYVDPAGTSNMSTATINTIYTDTVNSSVVGDPLELCYLRGNEVRIGPGGGNLPIIAGEYTRYAAGTGFLSGRYSGVETNYTTGPIYCINSSSYAPSASSLNSMYGIGYTDGANSGVWSGGGWGLYVAAGSGARVFLDGSYGIASATASVRAPIFYDSGNTSFYVDPTNDTVLNTLYFRNSSGANVLVGNASTFGYSSAYRTLILGNQAYTTVCIGVDPVANASGSFNGAGSGVEVMFKNGVGFITPNSANNSYNNPLYLLDGYAYNNTSMRSPIFYDYNNTSYYVDPASTSNFVGLTVANTITGSVSGGSGYANYVVGTNLGKTGSQGFFTTTSWTAADWANLAIGGGGMTIANTPGQPTTNYGFFIKIGNRDAGGPGWGGIWMDYSGGSLWYGSTTVSSSFATWYRTAAYGVNIADTLYASIYYDANNTAYYVDPASGSTLAGQLNQYGYLNIAYGGSAYAGMGISNTYASASNFATSFIDFTNENNRQKASLFGNFGTDGSGYLQFLSTAPGVGRNTDSRTTTAYAYYNQWQFLTSSGITASIVYDRDNTAYYVDPASTSVINGINVGSNTPLYSSGSFQYHQHQSPHVAYVKKTGGYSWYWRRNDTGLVGGANEVENMSLTEGGTLAVNGDMRAPIFYDSNNTAYYCDPTGTSNFAGLTVANTISGYIFGCTFTQDSKDQDNITTRTDSGFYQSSTGTTAEGWPLNDNTWQHMLSCTHTNDGNYYAMQLGASFFSQGLFYRSTNGSGSTAWSRLAMYGNGYAAPLYANIYYDADNTAYYVDAASESVLNTLTLFGELNLSAGTTYIDHTGTINFRNQSGYATSATLTTGGNFTATGNVTAYSDARLKKDVETIEGALDLVSAMRGVTYTRKDTGSEGIGVIAQEMREVIPQVVQESEDGTLSVAYGNLVGVLIEAVKELTARVAELEGK